MPTVTLHSYAPYAHESYFSVNVSLSLSLNLLEKTCLLTTRLACLLICEPAYQTDQPALCR